MLKSFRRCHVNIKQGRKNKSDFGSIFRIFFNRSPGNPEKFKVLEGKPI